MDCSELFWMGSWCLYSLALLPLSSTSIPPFLKITNITFWAMGTRTRAGCQGNRTAVVGDRKWHHHSEHMHGELKQRLICQSSTPFNRDWDVRYDLTRLSLSVSQYRPGSREHTAHSSPLWTISVWLQFLEHRVDETLLLGSNVCEKIHIE